MRVFKRSADINALLEQTSGPTPTRFDDQRPAIGFGDVAGLDGVLDDLRDVVGYLANPQRYEALGARPPTGILLFGEPGCGKTLLARALAGEVGVPFYFISATSFVERFVGLGAARIRELFATAAADSPSIVFVDELDAVGRKRTDGAGDREFDHTLNQLLVELDGFLGTPGVITIAATNRPELLDPALVRPGRFDRVIEIVRPDRDGRDAVLRLHAGARPCAADIDWAKIAEATDGCTPSELAGLINEAALLAARRGSDSVGWSDVRAALDRITGVAVRSATITEPELRRRAAHAAGHAVVALRLPDAAPRVRWSLMSCGRPAPANRWSETARKDVWSVPELHAELVVLMAGRAAETLLTGSPSTLFDGDLASATDFAEWVARSAGDIDDRYRSASDLLASATAEAERLVTAELAAVDAVAAAFFSTTSMFGDEIRALIDQEPAVRPR